MNIASAIIAGGKNSRMGENKALIKVNNTPIIERTISVLKELFDEIFLVTNLPEDFKMYRKDMHIIGDIIKDVGPLGGIHSALSYATKDAVFFVACDMPFLHNDMIRRELSSFNEVDCDVFVPRIGNRIEPLHTVYKTDIKDKINYFIENTNNYSIKNFLETVSVYYWDVEDNSFNRNIFTNLNTQEDIRYAGKIKGLA